MKKVVTIGLGYIGLPTSALISSNDILVHGVDINPDVVDTINKGKIHIDEPDLENFVRKSVERGKLSASLKPVEADIYLIVVPTPFDKNNKPDISYVKDAIKSIINFLKEGDLIIIESTCPVGTTEKMSNLIFAKRKQLKDKIFIAYCPERVLPGNIMYELVNNDRVIGGINSKSTIMATKFYSLFVKGNLHETDARTAEMCKLVENSSRDVQIAFANELSIVCDKAGINVWELIELANKHPRVNILNPGCGVGGHCIAVDPYFIISDFKKESRLISEARKINNFKPEWCLKKIHECIEKFQRTKNKKPSIAVLGLTFKPNIDDLRESPALKIAKSLNTKNTYEVFFVEPNVNYVKGIKLTELQKACIKSDIIVKLVNHREFLELDLEKKEFIDFCSQ